MTNEELAVQIQAGEREQLPELWEQVHRLLALMFRRLLSQSPDNHTRAVSAGITLEDLEQEGYFALLEAVDAYDPTSGYKFTAYLKYPVMKRFSLFTHIFKSAG